MIVSKQKPFVEIQKSLEKEKRIFLVGCAICATVCRSGGREEVLEIEKKLRSLGKKVTGSVVLQYACHTLNTRATLLLHNDEVEKADAILSLACGVGTQSLAECTTKPVHPGLDTLFVGHIKRFGQFEERCALCGECILDSTGGFCPYARCPKEMLNGPCGGAVDGKCEVDKKSDCVWVLVYERLKKMGREKELLRYHPPKDFRKIATPRTIVLPLRGNRVF